MKRKVFFASMLALLLACAWVWSAFAVALHGKDISTIPDILKEARSSGITDRIGANLDIPKHSILRLHNGKLDLLYNIGSGDTDLSLGSIRDYSTGSTKTQDNGISATLAATKFGSKKILVASSKNMSTQQGHRRDHHTGTIRSMALSC